MCAGVRYVVSYKRNIWYDLSCLLQTCCCLSIIIFPPVSWQFFETYGIISYGSGWRKDVVNQCLEFEQPAQLCQAVLCVTRIRKRGALGYAWQHRWGQSVRWWRERHRMLSDCPPASGLSPQQLLVHKLLRQSRWTTPPENSTNNLNITSHPIQWFTPVLWTSLWLYIHSQLSLSH